MDERDFSKLLLDDLCDALHDRIHEAALLTLREEKIDGAMFIQLTEDDLKELFPQVGVRLSVAMVLRERRSKLAKNTDQLHSSATNSKVPVQLTELTVESSRWVFSFDFPERFSKKTMMELDSGTLTSASRIEIVNAVYTRMLQHKEFPTPFEYRTVCRRLVEKYPSLMDKTESGYGTWKEQLKQKFRNGRRATKRPNVEECTGSEPPANSGETAKANKKKRYTGDAVINPAQSSDANYLTYLEELTEELKQTSPSTSKVKCLMEKTFKGRRSWIQNDTPSVLDIISVFPALRQSNRIRRELKLIVGAEKDTDFLKNWSEWVEKILSYAEKETKPSARKVLGNYQQQVPSEEVKSIYAIYLLMAILSGKSKDTILHEIPDTADIDEEAEKLSPFPQVIVLEHDEGRQYYVIVERRVLLESDTIQGSVLDLISAYFTFDIMYPARLYPTLLFIQHVMLNIVDKQRVPNNVAILRTSLV